MAHIAADDYERTHVAFGVMQPAVNMPVADGLLLTVPHKVLTLFDLTRFASCASTRAVTHHYLAFLLGCTQ